MPMPSSRVAARSALVLTLLALAGCDRSATAPGREDLSVSGTLTNRTAAAIPANARVVVGWQVSSGSPDYVQVFGEGTVDAQAKTFQVRFDAPPPADVLNAGRVGVGFLLLTTDATIGQGTRLTPQQLDAMVGAAGQHAVLYAKGSTDGLGGWVESFPAGYSVGEGVERTGDFDGFAPTGRTTVEIVVDAMANIDFVNWT